MTEEQRRNNNLLRLRRLLAQHRDPRDAFREFTDMTIAAIAERIGMRRADLNRMLTPWSRRLYSPERRIFESEFELPVYSLDELLDLFKEPSTGDGDGNG